MDVKIKFITTLNNDEKDDFFKIVSDTVVMKFIGN